MNRLFASVSAVALIAALCAAPAQAQFSNQQPQTIANPVVGGHLGNAGSGSTAVPVVAGGTIVAGSSDTDGSETTSAASGSITFAVPYVTAPFCEVVDTSATSTVSMPVYTVSATAITLSTIITAHVLNWHCAARVGG